MAASFFSSLIIFVCMQHARAQLVFSLKKAINSKRHDLIQAVTDDIDV